MNTKRTPPAHALDRRPAHGPCLLALPLLLLAAPASAQPAGSVRYEKSGTGTTLLTSPTGVAIQVLVEAANLGSGEVEVAEITFPAGSRGGRHHHGSIEILYLLEGRMDHVVNGVSHLLEPGMIGIVRPEDSVEHHVLSPGPVRALAVWAPGGEVARLSERFTVEPAPRR